MVKVTSTAHWDSTTSVHFSDGSSVEMNTGQWDAIINYARECD